MPDKAVKVKNKSFTVYIELRNILRTAKKDKRGKYTYVVDVYIEGKLENKSAKIYAHSMTDIIYQIKKDGLKTKIFL